MTDPSHDSPETTREFPVPPGEPSRRIDAWLSDRCPDLSRSQIQCWIKDGRVTVDGEPVAARNKVSAGQSVRLVIPAPTRTELEPEDVPLGVVYEEDDFVVIDKPAGLQVHPGSGPKRATVVHGLLHRYPGWDAPGPEERPGVVHRLDRSTSGLMVVARTHLGYQSLGRQIRDRTVSRRYVALVWGNLGAEAGRIDAPIGRHSRERTRMAVRRQGRTAATNWRVLERFEQLTLVEAVLETGRTHQIRVHFAHLGHPVFGDPTYGRDALWVERFAGPERSVYQSLVRRLNRQALHAYHLAFDRPGDGKRVRCEAPVPTDMEEVLYRLAERGMNG
ncbi:MAG: RluA family pseudouridine synthase [Candidatus Eisenbacteria bacterium]